MATKTNKTTKDAAKKPGYQLNKISHFRILQKVYTKYSREHVYDYDEHVKLAKDLDKIGKLPSIYMVVAPGSWNQLDV